MMKRIDVIMMFVFWGVLMTPLAWAEDWYKNVPSSDPGPAVGDCDSTTRGEDSPGWHWVPCCPCGGSSANGASVGSAAATTGCSLDIGISLGRNRPRSVLPGGLLRIVAEAPTAALYSPQGAGFTMGRMISQVSSQLTTNGTPRRVTVLGAKCEAVVYEFADNVATGLPTGRYSARYDRLVMVDAAGHPVLSNPVYYDLVGADNSSFRYGGTPLSETYLGLISYTTPYGRTSILSDGGVKVLRDENNILRQIVMPQCFVDFVTISDVSYEMRFYHPVDRGIWDAQTSRYSPTGMPFVVFRLEDPDNGSFTRARFSKIVGSSVAEYDYTYAAASREWKLVSGLGLRTESKDSVWDENQVNRLETRLIKDAAGKVASRRTEKFHVFPFGERVVESTFGSGDDSQLTVTEYYANAAETGRYSRVKSVVNPDGSWAVYDYDAQGRKTQEVASCGNSGTNNLADGKITSYGYAFNDPRDTTAVWDYEPRQTSVTVGGVVVSKSYYTSYRDDNGDTVESQEFCVDPSAAYGDTNSQREVVVHYSAANTNEALRGQIKSHLKPDGGLTTYTYEYGMYYPGSSEPGEFLPDPSGEAMRIMTVHGTALHPEGVPFLSTREISVKDEYSSEVLNERDVFVGEGTYQRIAWSAKSYDFYGHLTDEWKSSGLHASTAWGGGCCGKDSDVTETGIETVYSYDPLNRLISKTRIGTNGFTDGVTTTYVLDAAGKGLSETVSAGGLSQTTSNVYDSAGRLVWTMDAAGLVAEYLNTGLVSVATRAGVTNVTEKYLDGRTMSTAQNGVLKSFHTYGVNPAGTRWTIVFTGPAGTNSPDWQKTTTDLLGRTIKDEKPGFGGTIVVTTYAYNSKGQLISTTQQPNNTTTLSEYNELGQQIRSGLDVNTNGVLDLAGPDRVTETASWYEQDLSNEFWQCRASILYAGDNSATPTTNSLQKTRLTGFSAFSNLTSEMVAVDILRNITTSRTFIDRAAKTVTQVVSYPDSTTNAEQGTVNGLLISSLSKTGVETTYAYDALGRQTCVSTGGQGVPRTVGSFTTYNSLGQVASTMDAANNTTTYAYDNLGRRIQVTDALSNTIHTAYDDEGRVLATWGATYPVAYDYDAYGRMTAMYSYRGTNSLSSYSEISNRKSEMDRTSWLYDLATGLLTNKIYADGHGPAYTYTPDGKLATRTWARGVVTTYSYDSLGELTNISYSDNTPAVTFAFDRLGRQTTITDATGTRTFAYSDALQIASEQSQISNQQSEITYQYDTYGRSAGFDAGTNYSVRYTYDPLGRFSVISNNVAGALRAATYTYLSGSDLVQGYTTDTGFSLLRSYEPTRNLIASITNSFGGIQLHRFDYTNDQIGRRTQRSDFDLFTSVSNFFAYNIRSELEDAAMGTNTFNYRYDPIGNRRSSVISNHISEITTYAANSLNQYTNITDPSATSNPSYDLDGNMTSYRDWTFAWDAENRLVLASNATTVVSNGYDYMSRRISKTVAFADSSFIPQTSSFSYQGWAMFRETSASSTNSYIYGLDLSGTAQGAGTIGGLLSLTTQQPSNSTTVFYCYDANGNVTDLVDPDGSSAAHYEYDPYGCTLVKSGPLADANPFQYSTKYTDSETRLIYYGYRYYMPEIGRWASRDPIGEVGFSKVRMSRIYLSHRNVSPEYLFCANRVIDTVDPFGLTFVPPAPQYCYTVCDPIFGGGCYTVCLPPPPPPTTADCVCASGTKKGKHQNPNYNNVVNGCTGVGPGPFNFTPACNQHDTCYGTCNAGRANCDQQFLSNMQSICSQNCGTDQNCLFWCNATAQTYYDVVRMVGNSHYDGDGAACEDCCCP